MSAHFQLIFLIWIKCVSSIFTKAVRFIDKKTWIFKYYNTELPNISYIVIEHEAKLSIHQKDEPSKRALYAN